jgi:purine nucleosidase
MRLFRLTLRSQAHLTAEWFQRFHSMGNKVGPIFAELLAYAKQFDWQKYGPDQAPMHDPTTVVWLLQPELFSGREVNVEVETISPLTTGMTVIDWWGVSGRKTNAYVVRDIDVAGFYEPSSRAFAVCPRGDLIST